MAHPTRIALISLLVWVLAITPVVWYLEGRWFSWPSLKEVLRWLQPQPDQVPMAEHASATPRAATTKTPNGVALYLEQHEVPRGCEATASSNLQRKRQHPVYRWVDENGQIHLSDQEPTELTAQRIDHTLPNAFDYFTLKLRIIGMNGPPFPRDTLVVGMTKFYHLLTAQLPVADLRKVNANVEIHATDQSFHQVRSSLAPEIGHNVSGFYHGTSNRAVVLHAGDVDRTLATAIHEAVHVINAGVFGRTPRWFNEGLAEYFERMEARGQAVLIPASPEWTSLLTDGSARVPLQRLFRADDFWPVKLTPQYYATSWAFLYFLLDPDRRVHGTKLFRTLAREKCDALNAVAFFDGEYPGGMPALQRDFERWLNHRRYVTHTF